MSEQVRNAVRRLGAQSVIFTGQAKQVSTDTCTVEPSDGGPPFFDVALKAHPSAKIYTIPTEGSEVVCAKITEQVVVVIGVSQAKQIVIESEQDTAITVGTSKIAVAGNGLMMEAGGETLKGILTDLLSALEVFAPLAAAPGSPCAPNPADIASVQIIKTKLQLLLA